MNNKYYLSVCCTFKNESHSLKEWIEHYIFHGIDHFYLINDNSDDDFLSILQPYIDKNIVELFNPKINYYLGRQRDMYNIFVLPKLKESKWLFVCDMDEYLWSKEHLDIKNILRQCEHYGQIQVCDTFFGSSGHISQPKYLIPSFINRTKEQPTRNGIKDGILKYFVNSDFNFTSLNIHYADFEDSKYKIPQYFVILDKPYFIINHYCCQSLDFWKNIKCTRGDLDNYLVRTIKHFNELDFNDFSDTELYEQNKILYETILH
jgi:hypothetical protein